MPSIDKGRHACQCAFAALFALLPLAGLSRAKGGTYRIRCIHGCHGGTVLRDMIRREYARHPRVIRLEAGINGGTTDLVLREL